MRSDNPLVSVIMPVYNCEKYIEKSLTSIIGQTYGNWELLICDDYSTDNTYSILRRYSDSDRRIKLFKNDRNQKQVATRNFLIQQAAGSLVAFQDGDDWSCDERLQKQIGEFKKIPGLGLCGTYAQYFDEGGKIATHQKRGEVTDSAIKSSIGRKNQFCGASIMVSREVLFQSGLYRDYFSDIGNEDYDLTSRIVLRSHCTNIPEFLYCVRQSHGSSSRRILSERQVISSEIVRHLISQRKVGKDFLELCDFDGLKKLEEKLLVPYKKDPSLVYRKSADINFYNGNLSDYFGSSLRALGKNYFKPLNWKYFISACYRMFKFRFSNLIFKI